MLPDTLTQNQYNTVYNLLSFVIASQLFTALFLVIVQPRVLARYRQALVVSAVVCGIAAYHYFRIFSSFRDAFVTDAVGGRGVYAQAAGHAFNEGTATSTGCSPCRCSWSSWLSSSLWPRSCRRLCCVG